jgi:hypothetical protein
VAICFIEAEAEEEEDNNNSSNSLLTINNAEFVHVYKLSNYRHFGILITSMNNLF